VPRAENFGKAERPDPGFGIVRKFNPAPSRPLSRNPVCTSRFSQTFECNLRKELFDATEFSG